MLYSVKNFIVTFVISALIFGVIAYFVSGFIMKTAADPLGVDEDLLDEILNLTADSSRDETEGDSSSDTEPPVTDSGAAVPFDTGVETDNEGSETAEVVSDVPAIDTSSITGDSFTVLLIGTDYRPDLFDDYVQDYKDTSSVEYGTLGKKIRYTEADTIMLVRIDKENGRFIFLPIPTDMRLIVGTQYFTLGRMFANYGRDWVISKINALTGVNIDYYAVVNITDLGNIIDEIGGITYDVPYDMYLYDERYIRALPIGETGTPVLEAGKQKIESNAVIPLLSFTDYPNGTAGRLSTFVDFTKAALTKITEPSNLSQISDLYNAIKNSVDTNFTLSVFSANADLIFSYEKFTQVSLTFPGAFVKAEKGYVFAPDLEAAVDMMKNYK